MRIPKSQLEEIFDKYNGKAELPQRLEEFLRNQKDIGEPVHAKKLYKSIERAIKEVYGQTLPHLEVENRENSQVYENVLELIIGTINALADFSDEGAIESSLYFVPACVQLVADERRRLVIRLESTKYVNTVLELFKSNDGCFEPLKSSPFVQNFDQLLIGAGDLELQVCMSELLFRILMSLPERRLCAQRWFTSCLELRRVFLKIREEKFESDCRNFLNNLNESQNEKRRVFSIPCREVYIGTYKVPGATVDNVDWFWTDFNLGSKTVSFFASESGKDEGWETVVIKAEHVIECRFNERPESKDIAMVLTMKNDITKLVSFCPKQNESYVKLIYGANNNPVTAANQIFPQQAPIPIATSLSPDVIASTPPKTSVAINAVHLSSRSKGVAQTLPTVTRTRKSASRNSGGSAGQSGSESEKSNRSGKSDRREPNKRQPVKHNDHNDEVRDGSVLEKEHITGDGSSNEAEQATKDSRCSVSTRDDSRDSGCVVIEDEFSVTHDDGNEGERVLGKQGINGDDMDKDVIGETQSLAGSPQVVEDNGIQENEAVPMDNASIMDMDSGSAVTTVDIGPVLDISSGIAKDAYDTGSVVTPVDTNSTVTTGGNEPVTSSLDTRSTVYTDDSRSVVPSEKPLSEANTDVNKSVESEDIGTTSTTVKKISASKQGRPKKTRVPRPRPAPKKQRPKRRITSTSESELTESVAQTRSRTRTAQPVDTSARDRIRSHSQKNKTAEQNMLGSGYNTEDWRLGESDIDRRKHRRKSLEDLQGRVFVSQSRVALINNVFRDTPRYSQTRKMNSFGPFEFKCTPVPKRNKHGLRLLRSEKRLYEKRKEAERIKKRLKKGGATRVFSKERGRSVFSDVAEEIFNKQEEKGKLNYSEGDVPSREEVDEEQNGTFGKKNKVPGEKESGIAENTTKEKKSRKAKGVTEKSNSQKSKSGKTDLKQPNSPSLAHGVDFSITEMLTEYNQANADDTASEKDSNDLEGVEAQPFENSLNDIIDTCLVDSPRGDLVNEYTMEDMGSPLELDTYLKNGETLYPEQPVHNVEQDGRDEDSHRNHQHLRTKENSPLHSNADLRKRKETSRKTKTTKRVLERKKGGKERSERRSRDIKEVTETQSGNKDKDEEEETAFRSETRAKVKLVAQIKKKLSGLLESTRKSSTKRSSSMKNRHQSVVESPEKAEEAEESEQDSDEADRSVRQKRKAVKEANFEQDEMEVERNEAPLSEEDVDICELFRKKFAKIVNDSVGATTSPRSARKEKVSSKAQMQRATPKGVKTTVKRKAKESSKNRTNDSTKNKTALERWEEGIESNDEDIEDKENEDSAPTKGPFASARNPFKFDVETPNTSRTDKDSGFVDNTGVLSTSSSGRKRTIDSRDGTSSKTRSAGARDETPVMNAKRAKRFGSLDVQHGSGTPRRGYRSNEETKSRPLSNEESVESPSESLAFLTQPSTKRRLDSSKGQKGKKWNQGNIGLISGPFTLTPDNQRRKQKSDNLTERNRTEENDDDDDDENENEGRDDDEVCSFESPAVVDYSFVSSIQPRKLFGSAEWSSNTKKPKRIVSKQIQDENEEDSSMEDTECDISIGDEVKFTLASLGQDMTKTIKKRQGYVNQMANSTIKLIMSKSQDIWEKHSSKRNALINGYTKRVNKYIQDHQDVAYKNQESEDKMLTQLRKHLETVSNQRKEQEKCLHNIVKTQKAFTEAFQELEKDSNSEQASLQNHLRKEMLRYRDQIIKDVQKQEIGNIKRRVQAMIGSTL